MRSFVYWPGYEKKTDDGLNPGRPPPPPPPPPAVGPLPGSPGATSLIKEPILVWFSLGDEGVVIRFEIAMTVRLYSMRCCPVPCPVSCLVLDTLQYPFLMSLPIFRPTSLLPCQYTSLVHAPFHGLVLSHSPVLVPFCGPVRGPSHDPCQEGTGPSP